MATAAGCQPSVESGLPLAHPEEGLRRVAVCLQAGSVCFLPPSARTIGGETAPVTPAPSRLVHPQGWHWRRGCVGREWRCHRLSFSLSSISLSSIVL